MAKLKRLQIKSNGMFQNWPVIDYDGQVMQKLTTKIAMPSFVKNNTQVFFNYTVREEDKRPDLVAKKFYGDPKLDWIVLFFNNIIDPTFEWPMNNEVFTQFIIDKYGSVAAASSGVYVCRQISHLDNITPDAYNALDISLQKYWVPNTDSFGNIIDYVYVDYGFELSDQGAFATVDFNYMEELSSYDYEYRKNEDRKVIRLLHPTYVGAFLSEYKRALG